MIGLNIGRVLAVLFLLLAMQGRLAGPFPFSAGWGDIITGVFAVPLLVAAVGGIHRGAIAAPPISCWRFSSGDFGRRLAAAAFLFVARLGRNAASTLGIRSDGAGAVLSVLHATSARNCARDGLVQTVKILTRPRKVFYSLESTRAAPSA